MKFSKELLLAVSVLCVSSGLAMADESLQSYAHPTFFGSQNNKMITAETDVVIGGKIYKPCHVKTIEGKENVLLARSAKSMLCDMKERFRQIRAKSCSKCARSWQKRTRSSK